MATCCRHQLFTYLYKQAAAMNFTRIARFSRILNRNLNNQLLKRNLYNNTKSSRCLEQVAIHQQSDNSHSYSRHTTVASPIGLILGFNLFKKEDDNEETPEDKLILLIKRSILCIQRQEYDKAEQTLHLALRMAQDLRHKDGVTYVYDVMANLAMERNQFQKAEKLFKDVMQRLFASGETEDSCKILHMSSKLAHMAHLQQHYEKALQGFEWTMAKIEENLKKLPDSEDLQELKAITADWYGQILVEQGKYAEAMKLFKESYAILSARFGEKYAELVPILNNLSVSAIGQNDTTQAKQYLMQALDILKTVPEATNEGVLQANLGLIYLKEGLLQQAKKTCAYAYKLGQKLNDDDSIDQAKYCIEEIKKIMSQD